MDLIIREKLEYVARRILKYPLHDAEKDYFLTVVMKLVSGSELSEDLVFKGGTAIYHCYLDQYRFSEDLDFTSINQNIHLLDLKNILEEYELFEVKKEFVSDATLKVERLKYDGILETPNSIKIEVDKLQNVYLEPVKRKYQNVWGIEFEVNVMDPIEICAEKIRACNDRFRYRDFYDLYMMVNILNLQILDSIDILPQKEIRKDISKQNILNNLKYAIEEVSSKSDTVYYKEEISSTDLSNFFGSLDIPVLNKNIPE
jgi:predicted nucleotidyltransferase component of viral defense system